MRRVIGFLKHAKSFLAQDTLKALYTGIVKPHFRYCCSVWENYGASERSHLQKLQNRAVRILTNSSDDVDAGTLLKGLRLKKIRDLIDSEIKIMVFKALNGLAPEYVSSTYKK